MEYLEAGDMGKRDATISGVLRQAIANSGMSLNALAVETGVNHGQLSRFIRSERSLTLGSAERLAEYFGLVLVANGGKRK